MEEIHNLRLRVEDSANIEAAEGLEDISLAICFLKPRTPVFAKLCRKPGENILSCKDFPGDFHFSLSSCVTQSSKHRGTEITEQKRKA